jgi:hypothetical protein
MALRGEPGTEGSSISQRAAVADDDDEEEEEDEK